MADLTVTLHAEQSAPLPGAEPEPVRMSVREVQAALMRMADVSPDHARLADIACAMLTRLDTIRDEAHFSAAVIRGQLERGGADMAARNLAGLLGTLDARGAQHTLTLPRTIRSCAA